jgi:hypothetical protein
MPMRSLPKTNMPRSLSARTLWWNNGGLPNWLR